MHYLYSDKLGKGFLWSFFLSLLSFAAIAQPSIGTTDFNSSAPSYTGSPITKLGYTFTANRVGTGGIDIDASSLDASGGSTGKQVFIYKSGSTASLSNASIKSSDGSQFFLKKFFFRISTSPIATFNITVTGYKDGVQVSGATETVSSVSPSNTTWSNFDLSLNSAFKNIDEFQISGVSPSSSSNRLITVAIDNITIAAAVTSAAPTANTGSANSITSLGAALSGTVTSNGASTSVTFEYGTDSELSPGTSVSATPATISASAGSTAVSATLTGLSPATTYYYRVKGSNEVGTSSGSIQSFKTLEQNVAPMAISLTASSVNENVAAYTTIGTLSTTDANTTDSFTYSLVAGNGDADNGSFSIDGDILQINASPDFETKSSYSILIESKDAAGAAVTKVFTITINDIDENPKFTSTPVTNAVVSEAYSYTISTTDPQSKDLTVSATSTLPQWLELTKEGGLTELQSTVSSPRAIAIGADGTVFAASSGKIYKISTSGTSTLWFTASSGSVDGMVINNGYLYFSNSSANKIGRIKTDVTSTATDVITGMPTSTRGIAFKDGFLYAVMSSQNKVFRANMSSTLPQTYSTAMDYVTGLSNPYGLDFDANGKLFIANYSSKTVVSYNGSVLTTVLSGFTNNLTDIKVDKTTGSLYVSNNSGLEKYIPSSNTSTYTSSSVASVFVNALGINASGVLAFGSFSTGKLYTSTGALTIKLKGTPAPGDIGAHNIILKADNGTQSKEQSFTITVKGPATLTKFDNINKNYSDASFELTAPSSNSEGAFTYTSSDTQIATISGSTVSLLKPGTTTITATQAASGNYKETSATATLTVVSNPTDISLSALVIDENKASGSQVGKFSSTDAYPGDTYTYSLVSGEGDDDNTAFTIAGDALNINAPADYETRKAYSILVKTKDSAGGEFTKAFTIEVNDMDESPKFTSEPVTVATIGSEYKYTIQSTDPFNRPLTLTATSELPAWLSLKQGISTTTFDVVATETAGIAKDTDGTIYIAGSSKIYKISTSGTMTEWRTKSPGMVYGLAISNGYLYISYPVNGGRVTRINMANPSGEENVLQNLPYASGIAIKDNYIYVSLVNANKVVKVPTSAFPWIYSATQYNYISTGLSSPFGLCFNSAGNLLVAHNNKISKYTESTQTLTDLITYTDKSPNCVKLDDNDNLYVGFYNNGVHKYSAGNYSTYTQFYPVGKSTFGLELNAGILYFSDFYANRVVKLESGSSLTGTPAMGNMGQHDVTLKADNGLQSKEQSFTITVKGLATLSKFDNINKNYSDASFELTAPNSNSEGAFSYTSSDTQIATISGSTVTLLKPGTTTLTATQAASGNYKETSTTATLTVVSNPTDISLSATAIDENKASGSQVGKLSSTDAYTNDTYTYSLVAGEGDDDNTAFTIVGDALNINAPADYETKNTYSIRVKTKDGAGAEFTKVLTIQINDMDEDPKFTSEPVTEATVGSEYKYAIQASDPHDQALTVTATSDLPEWLSLKQVNSLAEVGSAVSFPRAIAIDADGTTFAASGFKIYKVSPDGTTVKWIEVGSSGSVDGLAINNNYLYISSSNSSGNEINRVKIDDSSAPAVSVVISGLPKNTRGIAFKDGFLFAAMSDANKVIKANLNSSLPITYSSALDYLTTGLSLPYGISFDKTGSLLIANYGLSTVVKYNGSLLNTVISNLGDVTGVEEDASNNLYVSTSSWVKKYTKDQSSNSGYTPSDIFTGYVNAIAKNESGTIAFAGLFTNKLYKWENKPSVSLTGTPSSSNIGVDAVTLQASNGVQSKSQKFTITVSGPATLSNFASLNKKYGDADFTLTDPTSNSKGAFTYTSSDESVASISGSTVTVLKAGKTVITATQAASGYYTTASTTATLTVSPKDITVSLNASPVITKVYDGTDAATLASANYQLNGIVGNDEVTVIGSANYTDLNAGDEKTVKVTSFVLAGAKKDNYNVVTTTENVSGKITAKPITVSLNATPLISKVYDGTDAATLDVLNYKLNGIEGDDEVNATGEAKFADVEAGTNVTINVNGFVLGGLQSGNYNLTTANETVTGTIKKAPLTIQADNQSKTYGEANPALNLTYSGLVNKETALSPAPGVTTNATELSGVGTYDIEVSGEAANYEVTFKKGTLTVNKKALTVTAENKTKTYGDVNPALSLTYSGLVNGETALSPAPNVSTAATTLSGVGTYDILASGEAANYELTFKKGTLTVNKKALTVTAENKTKTYGDVNPALSVTYSGLVNGETALSPAPNVSTTATALSGVGTYDILASGEAANYDVSFNKGTLTVNKKALTVTAEDKTKTYGDANPALSVKYSGLVNGETALNPAPNVSTTATTLSGVGTYGITVTGEAANYNVTYVNGSLTVTKKALTITADNKEKFQGLALPSFSASYSGFVNNENSAVLATQPTFSTIADAMSPQGTYPITVSGATAANYAITFVPGVLTVKPGYPTSITLAATTLFENAAIGTLAGSLSSTSDDPTTTFKYELAAGNGDTDNSLFKIENGSNQIKTNAVLNFEQKASYLIRVRSVAQNSMLSLDKELVISISNVNEQPRLNDIAAQTICYTPAQQAVALSGITAGEDAGQSTQVTISTSNNALFEDLQVSQAGSDGKAQIRYTLAKGVSGSAVINLMVMDNGGTDNGGVNTILKSFVLNVNPLPVIAINSDKGTSLSKGEVAVLKADVSVANNGLTYQWSNANGILSGQNSQNLTVRPTETTTYTVTVTNANQCSSTETITIEVRADFQVVDGTNIVTPNGDGVNDNFVIRNIDMYPNNVVKIFDRAGRLLYSKINYGNEWTGTFNGSPLAEDTYYYIVDFGAGKQKIKGFITIVRD